MYNDYAVLLVTCFTVSLVIGMIIRTITRIMPRVYRRRKGVIS